jgi:uncharacterized protein (DUF2147 family)
MRIWLVSLAAALSVSFSPPDKGVWGKWRVIDDQTGKAVSVVEIFERQHRLYGRIVELLNPKDRNKLCVKCEGEDKNKPILGLVVIKGLKKDGNEYKDGKILDPKHGRYYNCCINLEEKDKLKVRGYVGVELLGRTQYWMRVK